MIVCTEMSRDPENLSVGKRAMRNRSRIRRRERRFPKDSRRLLILSTTSRSSEQATTTPTPAFGVRRRPRLIGEARQSGGKLLTW
jgi:hypothetical protein